MSELFSHLEATRASVETSAARTAREVFKIAADEGRHPSRSFARPGAARPPG